MPDTPRPTWIIDLHPEFPGSAVVRARLHSAVIVNTADVLMHRWPAVAPPVVGYGTMRMLTRLARVPGLGQAVFDDYAQLRCSTYYRYIYDLLGRACVFVPFSALPTLPLERMFGSAIFVRSDTNYKLFPASILAISDVAHWLDTYREHREELVVVSEVVPFEQEFRCFCRNGTVFCGSSYPDEPYTDVPGPVQRFAEQAAARMLPLGVNMVTVDVGVSAGRLRVVEIGGVNSWGIYGSHVEAFIAAMEAEACDRWNWRDKA
jgi:hypothetical protein